MADFLIPYPNIPTTDIGLPKLKEITVLNNENFLALDRLMSEVGDYVKTLDANKAASDHDHDGVYAPVGHDHSMQEISGLMELLDQKAPLVHEHPQYLTDIPVHSHSAEEVDGLLESLASKAERDHSHNIGDIYGLDGELDDKANWSSFYALKEAVDDKVEIGYRTNPSATNGCSEYPDYNRTLPGDKFQAYLDNPYWVAAIEKRLTGLDEETPAGWERGKTAYRNGHVVDEDHPPVGCSVTVCTHITLQPRPSEIGTGNRRVAYFSRLDFDESGLLVRAVPCEHCFELES